MNADALALAYEELTACRVAHRAAWEAWTIASQACDEADDLDARMSLHDAYTDTVHAFKETRNSVDAAGKRWQALAKVALAYEELTACRVAFRATWQAWTIAETDANANADADADAAYTETANVFFHARRAVNVAFCKWQVLDKAAR